MNTFKKLFFLVCFVISAGSAHAQVDESQVGAWYMYFFSKNLPDSRWGFQGDAQYRNWDLGGDLEQLLLRSGLTYRPESINAVLTLGYANITSGAFGDSSSTRSEDRIYQEALLPHQLGERVFLRHRFRFEQRWVDDQDFRTRFRYALFMDIPLNQSDMSEGAVYLALYNELFINMENDVGDGRSVNTYDRNRSYAAIGYSLKNNLKLQGGYMYQHSNGVEKGQIQLSLHQSF
ncbi:MAG: DUF2490 domain-containing protein [Gammaproteobacteria bacterium]